MSHNHFMYEDLFISVRDTRLRAFNRLMLAANYHEFSPKLARLYLRFVTGIDENAAASLKEMRLRIAAQGAAAVRQQIKYYLNPEESDIYEQDAAFRLYRTSNQNHPYARSEYSALQDEPAGDPDLHCPD